MRPDQQTIYIVDDDAAVRDSLGLLMDSIGLPTELFASAQDFLIHYDGAPGVLVLDVRMPGMSGLELQEALLEGNHQDLAIVFISGHGDIPMAVQALKRGALDFLPKPFRDQELIDCIHHAVEKNRRQHAHAEAVESITQRMATLTPREQEVMAMVADGKANKVIAIDLNISQRTVEIHRARMMEKMQTGSLAQLIRQLHQSGYFRTA